MKLRLKRKLRRIFSIYNILILLCIVISLVSLYLFFKPDLNFFSLKYKVVDGVKIVETNVKENEVITEKQARKTGVKQFKQLGENIKEDDLNIKKIQRKGEEYFYVVSPKNTMEIKLVGGKITRLNTVPID